MNILLNLWVHAIYNDPTIPGSESGPVVYYCNNTCNPITNYQSLSDRWELSKVSICRLKKLEEKEMITLLNFKGKHGSVIYLNNYLSVMFNTSDVLIDREEIAMNMKLPLQIPDTAAEACVPK